MDKWKYNPKRRLFLKQLGIVTVGMPILGSKAYAMLANRMMMGAAGAASGGLVARGLFGGGTTGSTSDVIDYVTIATTGNATDFGNLTVARYTLAGCSNNHGGL